MLLDICYYLGLTTSICFGISVCTYYFNRSLFTHLAFTLGWKSAKAYHSLSNIIGNFNGKKKMKLEDTKEQTEENNIISYNSKTQKTTKDVSPHDDLVFIKKKIDGIIYCKRT